VNVGSTNAMGAMRTSSALTEAQSESSDSGAASTVQSPSKEGGRIHSVHTRRRGHTTSSSRISHGVQSPLRFEEERRRLGFYGPNIGSTLHNGQQ
ncbi:hypothetical protein SARC_16129, partial [Sphaeroforma arctica JP610]